MQASFSVSAMSRRTLASCLSRMARFNLNQCSWEVTLKPSQAIRSGLAAVALTLLLAACVHPSAPGSASGSSLSEGTVSQAVSESSARPSVEPTTGLEVPESTTGGAVSISMAPAPVGRNANSGQNNECIQVKWLGNHIPVGDTVTVTQVTVQSPFTFDPGVTDRCEGAPSCVSYRFSSANDSGPFCNIGLGYMGGSIDDDGPPADGTMELTGYLRCPPDTGSAACQRDAEAMRRPGIGVVKFEVNALDETSGPSSSPAESPSSAGPESSPSPTAATSNSPPTVTPTAS